MTTVSQLRQLAHLNGVQIAYYGLNRKCQVASHESLLAVLRLLGSPVDSFSDVPSALREQRQTMWRQLLEPVIVAWNGNLSLVEIRLPSSLDAPLACHLKLENGEQRDWRLETGSLPLMEAVDIEGTRYAKKHIQLPSGLPLGYHRLIIEIPGKSEEALVISAPVKAILHSNKNRNRDWGVFLPLYSLHRQAGWGCGNYSDLAELASWISGMGGSAVATLPFLPVFLDHRFDPSPYSPVSRLMWSEFYLDVTKVPELQKCPPAQAMLASTAFEKELEALRSLPVVDYQRLMALKRRFLEEMCRCCFSKNFSRLQELRHFVETHPLVEKYARFRATDEKQRTSWQSWPEPLRRGLKEGDYDEETRRYHLYVQWLAHQQLESLVETSDAGCKLCLDLPLGVHPDGFDAWHWQDLFVSECSVGAPPDAVFTGGQNWTFPPQHPERLRRQGYSYFIACLRHNLRYSGILRIDHMMGFHRLFWIPQGMKASQGVYVRYPAEELYAILALESHRHKAMVVGEDLGTVPPDVRPAMSRHGLCKMYVVQYELAANPGRALHPVPANAVASLNTHDMPQFASFWQGLDIQQRFELGLLRGNVRQEMKLRDRIKSAVISFLQQKSWLGHNANIQAIMQSMLDFLSASRARVLLVNLEDLWQEVKSQNVPGTKDKRNWCRKARYTYEEFSHMPEVVDTLSRLDRMRKGIKHGVGRKEE